jgi:nucleoporin SEH1
MVSFRLARPNFDAGDLLISTGDDGSVKTWKRALHGQWMEYSQIEVANDP